MRNQQCAFHTQLAFTDFLIEAIAAIAAIDALNAIDSFELDIQLDFQLNLKLVFLQFHRGFRRQGCILEAPGRQRGHRDPRWGRAHTRGKPRRCGRQAGGFAGQL
ncbi:MAG: hypothetical protein ABI616_10105 [Pseudomonadota bacterium]